MHNVAVAFARSDFVYVPTSMTAIRDTGNGLLEIISVGQWVELTSLFVYLGVRYVSADAKFIPLQFLTCLTFLQQLNYFSIVI